MAPYIVRDSRDFNAIAVAVGVPKDSAEISGVPTCALLNDGRVQCWGRNNVPEFVGNLRGATALEMGGAHCALVDSGHVQCWDAAINGSVAKVVDGIRDAISITRVVFNDLGLSNSYDMEVTVEREKLLAPLQAVIDVEGTSNHICILTREQNVLCATAENSGPYDKVGKISDLAGVTALTAGSGYACALLKDGRVKCFNFYAPTASIETSSKTQVGGTISMNGIWCGHIGDTGDRAIIACLSDRLDC